MAEWTGWQNQLTISCHVSLPGLLLGSFRGPSRSRRVCRGLFSPFRVSPPGSALCRPSRGEKTTKTRGGGGAVTSFGVCSGPVFSYEVHMCVPCHTGHSGPDHCRVAGSDRLAAFGDSPQVLGRWGASPLAVCLASSARDAVRGLVCTLDDPQARAPPLACPHRFGFFRLADPDAIAFPLRTTALAARCAPTIHAPC
jgi:hypothetical protein